MIRVTIRQTAAGKITAVVVEGHAGYADAGQDIVCAATSAITIGTVNSAEKLLGIEPVVEVDEETGYLEWQIPEGLDATTSDQLQLLLAAMLETLKMIEDEYDEFIKIKIELAM